MIILAFDIAGRTGIAYGSAGGNPRATAVDLGKGRSEAVRFAKMIETTQFMLDRYKPDLVVYEAPIGGPRTSHFLVGIAACFTGQARLMGYDPKACSIASIRKHFLGKNLTSRDFPGWTKAKVRTEIKRQVIARCHLLGWPVRDDDEGDAVSLWDYAGATFGRAQSKPTGGLFHG